MASQQRNAKKESYSVLDVINVSIAGSVVRISGKSDLPTGAIVNVDFDIWGRKPSDRYIGVNKDATISDGRFGVSLAVPQRSEFKKGPYKVSILFTPKGQNNSNVIARTGANGENLAGHLVVRPFNMFNTLQLEKKTDLRISVKAPSYVFDLPSKFALGSAERVVAEYAQSWKKQDWRRMASLSQETWVSEQSDPVRMLKAWYDFKTLKGFKITKVRHISNTVTDVTFVVHYEAVTNEVSEKEITARVIKESAPYTPSISGKWGVNPTSTLKETDVR